METDEEEDPKNRWLRPKEEPSVNAEWVARDGHQWFVIQAVSLSEGLGVCRHRLFLSPCITMPYCRSSALPLSFQNRMIIVSSSLS